MSAYDRKKKAKSDLGVLGGLKDEGSWKKAVEHGKEVEKIAECSQPLVGRRHSAAGATFAAKTGDIQNLKEIFRSWDLDGTGKISQWELVSVMEELAKRQGKLFSRQDAEALMHEIDKNGDQVIDFTEFVNWVTDAAARHTVSATGDVCESDVKVALRDLYNVFDTNIDGVILCDEFKDSYSILQGALRLHPEAHRNTSLFQDQPDEIFRRVDSNGDGIVVFDEFFDWQKKLLDGSKLPNYKVLDLVKKVKDVLQGIKNIDAASAKGRDQTHNYARLEEYIKTLASTEKDLWQPDKYENASEKYENYWTDPPIGLSVHRLYRLHLATVGLQTSGVDDTYLCGICVPDVEFQCGARRWFASVTMHVTAFGNKEHMDHYYVFNDLTWSPLFEEARFHSSFNALHPDVRLFCMMKSRVDMGFQMQWADIQNVLREAVRRRLVTHPQHSLYNKALIDMAFKMLGEEGLLDISSTKDAVSLLESRLQLSPGQVMKGLSKLKIANQRELWNDEQQAAAAASVTKFGRTNSTGGRRVST